VCASGTSGPTRTTGLLLTCVLSHFGIEVDELDETNLSSITLTGSELNDTGVSTGTITYLLSHLSEEGLDGFLVLKVAKYNTT
jgi:hypothetical protein